MDAHKELAEDLEMFWSEIAAYSDEWQMQVNYGREEYEKIPQAYWGQRLTVHAHNVMLMFRKHGRIVLSISAVKPWLRHAERCNSVCLTGSGIQKYGPMPCNCGLERAINAPPPPPETLE